MTARPTPGRDRVLAEIRTMLRRGEWPTVRTLMKACGFTSTSTVKAHLDRLVRDGRITRAKTHPFKITLREDAHAKN